MTENGDHGLPHHEKLKKIRKMRGLKALEVAEVFHLSEREYDRLEAGDMPLKISHIEAFCDLVKISIIDFFSFDERVFFHNCEQAHAFGQNNTYNGSSLKERELYEARIKHLEDEVTFLRKQLEATLGRAERA